MQKLQNRVWNYDENVEKRGQTEWTKELYVLMA